MANRFWVPIAVTGIADNGSGLCRVTVGAGLATGKVTGETVIIAGVVGATEGNGTWVITAISSTTFDLQGSTFTLAYVSGGTVSGGTWNATNIGNWGTASGTGSGAAVPTSSDAVTFDGASNTSGASATCTVNTTVTVQTLTCGAYVGTLDFSANNNNVTLSASGGFNGSGTGTRTINLGNGLWKMTFTGSGGVWTMTTTTGLTFNANSSTIELTGCNANNASQSFSGGGLTYNIFQLDANGAAATYGILGNNTFSSLILNAPLNLQLPNGGTSTVTSLTTPGSSSTSPVMLFSTSPASSVSTISKSSGTLTFSWCGFTHITCSGGATFTAANSLDFGFNSGITITAPTAGPPGRSVF